MALYILILKNNLLIQRRFNLQYYDKSFVTLTE